MLNKCDKKYFAIFGGGGVRGIGYCGAYKALVENNISITGCAGSSIGAVFASLLAFGYNEDEIYDYFSNTGFEMLRDINMDIKKEVAFSKGNIFYDWIKEKLEKKYYAEKYVKNEIPPVTFKDLDYNLIIYSTDLTNFKFKEFSKKLTPDFEIAKAVRASVSMPGLFSPLDIDGKLIVDGDLLKSSPLWRLSDDIKKLDEEILEFRLEDNLSIKNPNNSIEYINRVYNAISGFATDYIIDMYGSKEKFNYIKINTEDISVIDFLIPKDKKKELYNYGYNDTNNYFKEFYPEKRKKLYKIYDELATRFLLLKKELNKINSIDLYKILCDIFSFLFENKQFLDLNIQEDIKNIKELLDLKYKTTSFFGIKTLTLPLFLKKEVENKINTVLEKVKSKTDNLKD